MSKAFSQLAITIWTWCVERDITLQADHLPGHLSSEANEESRTVRDLSNWMLNQSIFQQINAKMGPLEVDLFASCLKRQLLASIARGLTQKQRQWVPSCTIGHQFTIPVVSNTSLSDKGEKTVSLNSTSNTSVEKATTISSSTRTPGGLSLEDSSTTRPGVNATGARIPDATGSTSTDCLAYLRQFYTSRGISPQGTDLMLASWRDKTNSNYGSWFSRWASWCQWMGWDPLTGTIEDVVNFLAKLHSEGYKYHSLNSYLSNIIYYEYVDGVSVGSHPTVTRLLQGAFNNRPPQPRYSTFWDVGMVVQHFKGLGANKDFSLKQLTMKTVMLLALTRPSHLADMSKLSLQTRSYKANGVTFQPIHLSKQSRSSKPVANFFFQVLLKILSFVL